MIATRVDGVKVIRCRVSGNGSLDTIGMDNTAHPSPTKEDL
jgi:hypothetical protein